LKETKNALQEAYTLLKTAQEELNRLKNEFSSSEDKWKTTVENAREEGRLHALAEFVQLKGEDPMTDQKWSKAVEMAKEEGRISLQNARDELNRLKTEAFASDTKGKKVVEEARVSLQYAMDEVNRLKAEATKSEEKWTTALAAEQAEAAESLQRELEKLREELTSEKKGSKLFALNVTNIESPGVLAVSLSLGVAALAGAAFFMMKR
jgi:hypothetical protein